MTRIRKTKFGLRTYKGVGLASVLTGTVAAITTAQANVIDNGKASITLDSDKVKLSDKTATELYLGGGTRLKK